MRVARALALGLRAQGATVAVHYNGPDIQARRDSGGFPGGSGGRRAASQPGSLSQSRIGYGEYFDEQCPAVRRVAAGAMNHTDERGDRIEIKDLLLRCIIGINEDERTAKQDVLINIVMWADTRRAAASDDIAETVNYRTVTKQIVEHVENSQYYLLETLTERVAQICLQDSHVRHVRVSIEKPGALRFARSVGVRIERGRNDIY